jgi:hypothetical protein
MGRIFFILILLLSVGSVFAQEEGEHHNPVEKSTGAKHDGHEPEAIHNIKELFSKGHIGGDVRYFFMDTYHVNQDENYYANAIGGRLNYHTAEFKGFHIGLAGIFVFNMGSTEYNEKEPRLSIYELELFDLLHPHNKNDLDRMEELFLQYRYKKSFVKYGKMDINTPLMNPRDTRMKPYVFRGFWGEFNEVTHLRVNAGWIDGASPRSTTHWYDLGASIDLYDQGITSNGVAVSEIEPHTSDGVAILGVNYFPSKRLNLNSWWYHMHSISSSLWFQGDYSLPLSKELDLLAGGIFLYQQPLPNDHIHSYMDQDHTTQLYSVRLGLKNNQFEASANATWVSDNGRFVFPREFGRAKLYTLLPRSEKEGLGNSTTMALKFKYKPEKTEGLTVESAVARVLTPGIETTELNKYQIPSYHHYVLDIGYKFHKVFDGLDLHMLYVYKDATSLISSFPEDHQDLYFEYHNFNLIANIYF